MDESVRSIVRELPEILAQGDDFLQSPSARHLLRSNPLAEVALSAAADTVLLMRSGGRGRPFRRTQAPTAGRAVADAARHFPTQLGRVLFEHAVERLKQEIGGEYVVTTFLQPRRTDGAWCGVAALAAMTELVDDRVAIAEHQAILEGIRVAQSRNSALDAAVRGFRAVTELMAESGGGQWFLLYLRELLDPSVSAADWVAYAHRCGMPMDKARGQACAARLFARVGDFAQAHQMDRLALPRLRGDVVFLYCRLKHLAGAGAIADLAAYDLWTLASAEGGVPLACRLFGLDKDLWLQYGRQFPSVIQSMLRYAPSAVRSELPFGLDEP